MKGFLKVVFGLIVIGALALAWLYWEMAGAPLPSIAPARTKAPNGFDPSEYVALSSLTSTDSVTVVNLSENVDVFEHYTIPDLGVTYFIGSGEDGTSRVVVLNRMGAVIGDLSNQNDLFPMGQFMVAIDVYFEITPDRVSPKTPIAEVEVASVADIAKMIEESSHYRSYFGSDVAGNDPAKGINRFVHVMRHGGVWKRVTTNDQTFYNWKGAPFHRLQAQYRVIRAGGAKRERVVFNGQYRVELTHFDQQDYSSRRKAAFMSPTGQGRPAQWQGTGYYTVFNGDQPVLRFVIENDREILPVGASKWVRVHGGDGLRFVVIEYADHSQAKQVVVLRFP